MLTHLTERCPSAAQWALVAVFLLFPVAMGSANLAMALTIVFWLLSGHFAQRWTQVKHLPVVWAALALYGLVVVGCVYTTAPASDIWLHLNKYSKLLFLVLAVSLLSNEVWHHRCMNAYVAGMTFILVSVYANIWLDLPWSVTHNQGWGTDHTVVGDYITQNIMMTFFAVLAFNRALDARLAWQRGAWWATGLLAAISVMYLSQGRTGYILLGLVLLVFAWVCTQGLKRWVVVAMVIAGMGLALCTSPKLQERAELAIQEARHSDQMEITSIGGRINFWKYGWAIVQEHPLTGSGTGSYHGQWCETVKAPGWCAFGRWHPHNQFLFFWIEHGVLGIVGLAGLMLAPLWMARKAPPSQRRLLICLVAMFFADSLINAPLWSSRENHFFVFMLALLSAQAACAKGPVTRQSQASAHSVSMST